MHRRLFLTLLACCPGARSWADDEPPRPQFKISMRELRRALSERFPVRFGVEGVIVLQVSAPELQPLPATNQLGATLVARASGPGLGAPPPGEMDLRFGLRYEPVDRTVRAHHVELDALRLPGLPAESVQGLQQFAAAVADDAIGEIALHRFAPGDLALADTMGFEPERIVVADDGLVVVFGPKRRA